MVRNVPSHASLHAAASSKPSIEKPIDLTAISHVPIMGTDEQTKALMQSIASGSASEEDNVRFQRLVTDVQKTVRTKVAQDKQQQEQASQSQSGQRYDQLDDVSRQLADLSAHMDAKIRDLHKKKPAFQKHPGRRGASVDESISHTGATTAGREAGSYTSEFVEFMTQNPTIFHAVDKVKQTLEEAGFTEVDERDAWDVKPAGKHFLIRNDSSLVAFAVGSRYKVGNGAAVIAGHIDALTAKLKPVSKVPNRAGYIQLGVAPYAGAPNNTWWDRDLGIGGRVLVKEGKKIVTKLVKLDWPIARIPTLAPHFGQAAIGPFNPETQMTPIIGLTTDSAEAEAQAFGKPTLLNDGGFINTQPPKLVKAIARELKLGDDEIHNIVNWELELFDIQPAQLGGLDKEFIFAGRIDDKLCSWSAIQALVESADDADSGIIKIIGLFDNEEIGSLLRQGARGNLLPSTMERIVGALADHKPTSDLMGRTYANSFLLSADVIHATNPNFLNAYLPGHSPSLNTGLVVSADSNGHMTTDAVSTALLQQCADIVGAKLQVFQIRNDSRSGGTVGPMLSAATGMRAIDAGIPQLSMHSCRATTGSLDPGLGVITFRAFLDHFESVDKEFR